MLEPGSREDVARLARRVGARSVGVVLSGGGARGLAHIGVLDELLRAGMRIDRVGGTSMGAVVGGMFAHGTSPAELLDLARRELVPRRLFGDVVWPRHALIRGRRAELTLARLFGGAMIEDQRRRFFAVSVDLVAAERVVHRRGPIADAVGMSVRIPGIVPPRRVGERLHVDGGVLDNLPVGEMAAEREGPVLAVDVAQPFGIQPVGGAPGALPPIVDTIGRSMMIASGRKDDPARALAHTVLTPRLDGFGLFDFGRLDELVDRGREAARAAMPQLRHLLSG
ncbi:MAG: patatin-like phospholipase family protein [Pseudonocardia sp.]|nr:patatin-like phospholipase family protein [Pseudonocardia sp.]